MYCVVTFCEVITFCWVICTYHMYSENNVDIYKVVVVCTDHTMVWLL